MRLARQMLVWGCLPLGVLSSYAQAQHEEGGRWTSGKLLYEKVCGHCHAAEVGVGPALTGRGLPDAYFKVFVRNGLNAMPAFPATAVDDASITLLAEYLASLPPAPAPAPRPGPGGTTP
jgi:mono/diheme cytochrome c family protein